MNALNTMNPEIVGLLCIVAGYLCGSIMFAPIFAKLSGRGTDVYTNGNRNPGAANTFRTVGRAWGILTGILDAAKAFVPMLVSSRILGFSTVQVGLIGIGAVIGHGYPLYFGFKGGRGAATLMGVYAFLIPYELLISFVVAPIIIFSFFRKNVSLRIPSTILTMSAILMLAFHPSAEVESMVIAAGLCTLYFSRKPIWQFIVSIPSRIGKR